MQKLFENYHFGSDEKAQLDRDGHFCLPGIIAPEAQEKLITSLARILEMPDSEAFHPNRYAAELDNYLASLIAHPQMLELARKVLGENIRYDHCVDLSRKGGFGGQGWHSHGYAEEQPELGFVRIFFYVNGFRKGDGALKVVPGSHVFRDAKLKAQRDAELEANWMRDKKHHITKEPLRIEDLEVPAGSVILMWTHAAHAVSPRRAGSDTRWTVVYAYRNPGAPSHARWIREEFEKNPPPGAEQLMGL